MVAAVAHVLRYTPYTRLVRRLLDEGALGEVVSVQHLEPVGFWHHAHSYVRGNWRREDEAGPMLLAKCCHDLDWLSHVIGRRAVAGVVVRQPVATSRPSTGPRAPPTAAWTARSSPAARTRRRGSTSSRPSAARPAGRSTSSPGRRARARRGGAARRPLRPLRVGLRQRRRRPPGRLAAYEGGATASLTMTAFTQHARPRDADLRHRGRAARRRRVRRGLRLPDRAPRRATRFPAAGR